MIHGLKGLFLAILAVMLLLTLSASLERSVFSAGAGLWPDPWFRATLADAYCGFLTFSAWVFYREASWARRLLWFLGIMLLGNIAMALYMLILLFQLPEGAGAERLLLRPRVAGGSRTTPPRGWF
jgi:hypothetical protein